MNFSLFNNKITLIILLTGLLCISGFSQQYSDEFITVYLSYNRIENEGDSTNMNVTIYKKQIQGFAKFELQTNDPLQFLHTTIPNTAIKLTENSIRILWIDLPPGQQFTFNIPVKAKNNSEQFTVSGAFSYLFDKDIKQILISNTNLFEPSNNKDISVPDLLAKTNTSEQSEAVQTETNSKDSFYISDISARWETTQSANVF